jgi:hypothetical protein
VGGGTPTELAPIVKANRESPAIGGDTVAWVDLGSSLQTEREIFVGAGRVRRERRGPRSGESSCKGSSETAPENCSPPFW